LAHLMIVLLRLSVPSPLRYTSSEVADGAIDRRAKVRRSERTSCKIVHDDVDSDFKRLSVVEGIRATRPLTHVRRVFLDNYRTSVSPQSFPEHLYFSRSMNQTFVLSLSLSLSLWSFYRLKLAAEMLALLAVSFMG